MPLPPPAPVAAAAARAGGSMWTSVITSWAVCSPEAMIWTPLSYSIQIKVFLYLRPQRAGQNSFIKYSPTIPT